ncbi:hypothetical protein NA57DRAFT_61328 [Rhizodiscina lignyota]|uniref:Uncharacterized protein n=1 Tax=Rhizodiscina lignyota TaxID=1504668 RepID=A0A9P4I5M9_9PEZI|nr:hypothetical protein NA57DRAFT_61328 [Rhizodiscina lignyota]
MSRTAEPYFVLQSQSPETQGATVDDKIQNLPDTSVTLLRVPWARQGLNLFLNFQRRYDLNTFPTHLKFPAWYQSWLVQGLNRSPEVKSETVLFVVLGAFHGFHTSSPRDTPSYPQSLEQFQSLNVHWYDNSVSGALPPNSPHPVGEFLDIRHDEILKDVLVAINAAGLVTISHIIGRPPAAPGRLRRRASVGGWCTPKVRDALVKYGHWSNGAGAIEATEFSPDEFGFEHEDTGSVPREKYLIPYQGPLQLELSDPEKACFQYMVLG